MWFGVSITYKISGQHKLADKFKMFYAKSFLAIEVLSIVEMKQSAFLRSFTRFFLALFASISSSIRFPLPVELLLSPKSA